MKRGDILIHDYMTTVGCKHSISRRTTFSPNAHLEEVLLKDSVSGSVMGIIDSSMNLFCPWKENFKNL